MKYIDTHSHIHDKALLDKRDLIILKMKEEGIASITIGTDLHTSMQAMTLAQSNSNIFYTIGVHPCDDSEANFNEKEFEKLISDRCVAIGECGLDYYYFDKNKERLGQAFNIDREVDRQQQLFIKQIEFAKKYKLPLMLHGRPSDKNEIDNPTGMDAYEDMIYILNSSSTINTSQVETLLQVEKTTQRFRGNVHFFVGNVEIAKKFLDLGFDFSFGGVVTLTHDYDEVLRYISIERIHAETDSPYVSPKNENGKRASIPNTPLNIKIIIEKIAEIKRLPLEDVERQLLINAERLYLISSRSRHYF